MELLNEKGLRRGITTGTCGTAAAKAAALASFGNFVSSVELTTPKGELLTIEVEPWEAGGFGVRKYSGDDPDITDGILICAQVRLMGIEDLGLDCRKPVAGLECSKIRIDGGEGVGRVTLPGLACPVGEAAINPVPRKMIGAAVAEVLDRYGYEGGALVTISVPRGRELAKRTYNPRLGIQGGLSILGTSGMVEPMSSQALIDTIKVEMDVRRAAGAEYLIITPGNYGEQFIRDTYGENRFYSVKCSNFVGESLDLAEQKKFKGILFAGHIGKLVKVAGGIMNTHSSYADGRMEILAAHGAMAGGTTALAEKIMNSVTTDSAYEAIFEESQAICKQVMDSLLEKIKCHMEARTHGSMKIHALMFSNKHGLLGCTKGFAEDMNLYFEGNGSRGEQGSPHGHDGGTTL